MTGHVKVIRPFEFTASVFDEIMRDFPYRQWLDYIESLMALHGRSALSVLDMACGTGSLAVEMASGAYTVWGLDASEDMIGVARAKCAAARVSVQLSVGDMRRPRAAEPPVRGRFDLVTCTFDSLNALTEEGDLDRAMRAVADLLAPRGTFIADFNTAWGLSQRWGNRVVRGRAGDVTYEWAYSHDADRNLASLHMKFMPSASEEVLVEEHHERAYEPGEIAEACRGAGMSVIGLYDDRSFDAAATTSDRVFVVAGGSGRAGVSK